MVTTQKLTPEEIQDWISAINGMSHFDLAQLYRFSPTGHPVFDNSLPINAVFHKRFDEFGGWTPEISKALGLERKQA